MLPTKPLSEMTENEALEWVRASRIKRVADKDKAVKTKTPRTSRKATNNTNATNILEQINAALRNGEGEGNA